MVTRYAHQQGYHVDRRFGWDCHGLPVEFEIDKALNIRGPEDVAKMGIAAYNGECRKIVMRYADDWERIISRMGRWIGKKLVLLVTLGLELTLLLIQILRTITNHCTRITWKPSGGCSSSSTERDWCIKVLK